MSEDRPKKSLGQHWLYDIDALQAIVAAADVQPGDIVLEIGPGLGTLTVQLLSTGAKVVAVEFDAELAENLQKNIQKQENLEVRQGDILDFDFTTLSKNFKVVANIPYYLTSNLIRRMCESPNSFSTAALLVQKEVAERVCAAPGATSLLSISTQFYCEVSLGQKVPAELFTPPPKVDSQVLILKYHSKPLFEDVDEKQFFRLVKAGFSERRKMLRSSLSGGLGIDKAMTDDLLKKAGIDGRLRAQALTMQQWYDLYKQYYSWL